MARLEFQFTLGMDKDISLHVKQAFNINFEISALDVWGIKYWYQTEQLTFVAQITYHLPDGTVEPQIYDQHHIFLKNGRKIWIV